MDRRIIILVIVGLLANKLDAVIWDCAPSSYLGQLIKPEVEGCAVVDPECKFHYFVSRNISITFEAKRSFPKLKLDASASGDQGHVVAYFHVDPCKGSSGLECPLAAGNHTFSGTILLPSAVPKADYNFKFALTDGHAGVITCIDFMAFVGP